MSALSSASARQHLLRISIGASATTTMCAADACMVMQMRSHRCCTALGDVLLEVSTGECLSAIHIAIWAIMVDMVDMVDIATNGVCVPAAAAAAAACACRSASRLTVSTKISPLRTVCPGGRCSTAHASTVLMSHGSGSHPKCFLWLTLRFLR